MKEQILKLWSEGKTQKEIQGLTGASKSTISYHCNNTTKARQKVYNKKRRLKDLEWLAEIKSKLFCKECKEDRWWLLDFHHRNPNEKDGNISDFIKSKGKEKVLEEIEKCEVLCSNCHRDLHFKEKSILYSK